MIRSKVWLKTNIQTELTLESTIKKSFGFGTTLLEIELRKCAC